MVAVELEVLAVADAAGWRDWLAEHHATAPGVWLVIAKKGTTEPTSISYEESVLEALCYGWIDGHTKSRDAATFIQRYTPRRAKSNWSASNVARVERLIAEGRMRPAGQAEVDRAKADGRWAKAQQPEPSAR